VVTTISDLEKVPDIYRKINDLKDGALVPIESQGFVAELDYI
jgi:hypothetical protein